jgi:hypothetical protein
MPQRVHNKHYCHQADTGSDHAQRQGARDLMLHDQRDSPCDHQQEGKPAEATVAVVMMAVMVTIMVMAPVPGTPFFPGVAVFLRTAFVQREFIAHADIDFTHWIFPKVAATAAAGIISS